VFVQTFRPWYPGPSVKKQFSELFSEETSRRIGKIKLNDSRKAPSLKSEIQQTQQNYKCGELKKEKTFYNSHALSQMKFAINSLKQKPPLQLDRWFKNHLQTKSR